ncbi:hypothetical protein MMC12_003290 [Toensbergia leucococca]|nr:hypothetical protein [Toensbergia leucococca]
MIALPSYLHDLLSNKTNQPTHLSESIRSGNTVVLSLLILATLTTTLWSLYSLIQNDYHAFLSLGPGGTPSTFSGYLRVTYLRVFHARVDTYTPQPWTPSTKPLHGHLHTLPSRLGPRPRVAGIAPHRQTTQHASPETKHALTTALDNLAASRPTLISTGISCFEKHNLGLFFSPRRVHVQVAPSSFVEILASGDPQHQPIRPLNPTCGLPAEITHLHAGDGSMHVTLHPADAAMVLSHGWGERHPLAGRGKWVPEGFVMVYAPRGRAEVEVVMQIVGAGAWWVGGCDLTSGIGTR